MTLCEKIISEGYTISNCPFCGFKLSEMPMVCVLRPVHSEEYLIAKLNKGHFLGSDNSYAVNCVGCGATGGWDTEPRNAIKKWNRRTDNGEGGSTR